MAAVAEVDLTKIEKLPDGRFAVFLVADDGQAYSFVFGRKMADYGRHTLVLPDDLEYPPGSISSLGTFLIRVVGSFRVLVEKADVAVAKMSAKDSATRSIIAITYTNHDDEDVELVFHLSQGPLKPANVKLTESEWEQAALIGLDKETVGEALYFFGRQLREKIEIIPPADQAG